MSNRILKFFIPFFFIFTFFISFKIVDATTSTTFSSPNISILDASSIKHNQATLNAKIESLNNLEYVEWWFEYGIDENNLLYKSPVTKETTIKSVAYAIANLSQDSSYYYRFCEKNIYETSCTAKKSLKTYSLPLVSVLSATQIGYGITYGSVGYGAAMFNGKINNPGTDSKGYGAEYWFEYGIGSTLVGSKNTTKKITAISTNISEFLNTLTSNSEYYYKLCAKNDMGSVCSDATNFKTYSNIVSVVDTDKPVVLTLEAAQTSTANSIKFIGKVAKMGKYNSLNYYFEYDENLNFRNSIDESKTITQVGEFSYILPGITYNKTYYYRACVKALATTTNNELVVCGEPKVFTLSDYKNSVLGAKNYEILNLRDTSAKISGIVTGFGGYDTANAWFIFYDSNTNTSSSYGYGETRRESDKIQVSGTSRIFSIDMTNLTPGKRYSYSVCVANNSTAYCNNDRKYFYTLKNPSLEIGDYRISDGKLYLTGKLLGSDDYYKDTISYGWFEYGTTESLTNLTQTTKTVFQGNTFGYGISGLQENTIYYARSCVNIGLSDVCSNIKKITFENVISEPKIEIVGIDKNQNNIKIYAKVVNFGGDKKVSTYLEYGTTKTKFEKTNNIEITKEGDDVFAHINNIKNDTKYYYRYCVKNSNFTKCTEIKEISVVSEKIRKSIPKISDDDRVNFFIENDFAEEKSGEILMKTDDQNNLWYVDPSDLKRYLLGDINNVYLTLEKIAIKIDSATLNKIPVFLDMNYGKDTDKDGLSDSLEKAIGTNYKLKDSDKDGFSDLTELKNNYNPNNKKALKLLFDNTIIKNNLGKFFITDNNDVWFVGKNKKRYYIGNIVEKTLIFDTLKKIANKIYYEDLIRIDYVDTEEVFSDMVDSDYDGITDKYEITQ